MAAKPRSRKRQPVDPHRALRDHVRELLRGGHAHLVFKDAIADWPTALRGAKPAGHWPPTDAPPDDAAWDRTVAQVERDRRAMERLVSDAGTDLFARIPYGTGQTVLREALLVADHTAYHVGQLVLLRRLLGVYAG